MRRVLAGAVLVVLAWIVARGLPLRAGDRDLRDPPSPKVSAKPRPKPRPRPRPAPRPAPEEEDEPPAERRPAGGGASGMVRIPAGEFLMGSNDGANDEKPAHRVWVDAFLIDRYEVTNRRYRAFMDATGHRAPGYWTDSRFNAPEQPVVGVDWDDAVAFARWEGKRLPTEAEWERASRGGREGGTYPWGDADPPGRACYGLDANTGRPQPVGRYAANGFGLHDMAGNVWEWCADRYGDRYYAASPARNPRGPSSGEHRVVRGGSWFVVDYYLRCADRYHDDPARRDDDGGFRCARSL